jgi:hypothetical protein
VPRARIASLILLPRISWACSTSVVIKRKSSAKIFVMLIDPVLEQK